MNENRKIPELRFPEYTDDWKDYRIGELFDERREKMPDGELLSVTIKDGIKKHSESGRRDSSSDDKSNYKKVCVGDIAYNSMRMWQGASGFSEYEGIISPAYTVIKPKENVDARCAAYLFKRKKMTNIFQRHSQGVASDTWNLKYPELSQIHIMFPRNVAEQHRISSFFSKIDSVIVLQQQYVDQLKEFKKGCLQKMFPKKGEKVPEMRFPGVYNNKGEWVAFTDDWEQRKLSDCAGFRRGSFPQPYGKKDWYDGEGAMPFVQVADVSDDMKLVDDTKQKISKLAQPMSVCAEEGSVLVTLQGSIGRVAIAQYKAFVDRTVLIFDKYTANIDKIFWAYIIKEKFIEEARKAPGGTIKTITKEVLSDFDLMLPSYDEQKMLGKLLNSLDNLITLHQCKLDEMKEFKKGCLQKMFV